LSTINPNLKSYLKPQTINLKHLKLLLM